MRGRRMAMVVTGGNANLANVMALATLGLD